MPVTFCPVTGYQITPQDGKVLPASGFTFDYEHLAIGKAIIALPTYNQFVEKREFKHPELAGICRNAFEDDEEPPIINTELILNLKNRNLPRSMREKSLHLLKFMYRRGGKDYQDFDFSSMKDYPLVFAEGAGEFNKIIRYLESKLFIEIGHDLGMAGHMVQYNEVKLTDYGIEEVEKELPAIPLIGLVQQEIATGDASVDAMINHAKKLFFDQPPSMEKMRSACETLSFVLEPLREDLKSCFAAKDVSDFFNIVNSFDIRHNRETTKALAHPEQLEWVFYTLLNTINTYVKLKAKL